MLSRKQSGYPRGKGEEGGVQVVASFVPFQNSYLAGHAGYCARRPVSSAVETASTCAGIAVWSAPSGEAAIAANK